MSFASPYVIAEPEMLLAAAGDLQELGVALSAHPASAAPATGVVPAAADEVSALTAAQFAAHAAMYQAVSTQAAVVQDLLAQTLAAGAARYTATETANAAATG